MSLSNITQRMSALPKNVQELANRAMLYVSFALASTEKEMLTNNKISRETAVTFRKGSESLLGNFLGGVVTEQTQAYAQQFRQIMDRIDRFEFSHKPEYGPDGQIVGFSMQKVQMLTEDEYGAKKAEKLRGVTDLQDDYPIELSWRYNKLVIIDAETARLLNQQELVVDNIAVERTRPTQAAIETFVEFVHVKSMPAWRGGKKLLEFYSTIASRHPAFHVLQEPNGIREVVEGLTNIVLTKSDHNGDQLHGYRIEGFDKVTLHNGRLVFKLIATDLGL